MILLETQYLPTIDYIEIINQSNGIVLDDLELYQKQSYRNRTTILSANGPLDLIVPVGSKKKPIKKISIDYNQNWVNNHLGAIKSAYGRAPFYEHFFYLLECIYKENYTSLLALNHKLLTICLNFLQIEKKIVYLSEIQKDTQKELITEFKERIHPKKEILNKQVKEYTQLFGNKFVSNLSVLDLLFCEGRWV